MAHRNPFLSRVKPGYLFPEINKRKKAYLLQHPQAKLLSLGVGDTTQPIPPTICQGLTEAARQLGTKEGYTGYSPEQGYPQLCHQIAAAFYNNKVKAEDIFISDGSKCDIGRLQTLFGAQSMALQNPTYPVYLDTGLMVGQEVVFMPCSPANNFVPDFGKFPRTDLIFFCSPNNPTGATANRQQLELLVDFARRNKSVILYDAAYAVYIKDQGYPRSIYEIDGAEEVAIELNSFSKMAGFTGVRLGWTVVPDKLKYEDGGSVKKDWSRITSTFFNGAANISQMGGVAALSGKGLFEIEQTVNYYLENASLIKNVFEKLGFPTYGGQNAPYVWVNFNLNSWEIFDKFMTEAQIIATPGSGFGSEGEGFLRFSAFGNREDVLEAIRRIQQINF